MLTSVGGWTSTLGEPACRDKMMKPRYQEISAERIPHAQTFDGSVLKSLQEKRLEPGL